MQHKILYNYFKIFLDLVGGFLFLIIVLPLFPFIAILIKLDSKGPIFYLQERCGKEGKIFKMFKFRTMVNDAELIKKNLTSHTDGPMFKMIGDPRITRVGKILRSWSLDELPQLINVLKGEMSLVGPRPLANSEMTGNENWKNIRLSVKPGVTGLWQIEGRGSGKFSDWVKYDKKYVQNKSFVLDTKILFSTVTAIFKNERAH
ncbi:MAG: sugar transferase [Candidatus Brocadiaceae bacterium]|nr:sugar transferase [Candidatus Brocadiaceae bacterium]